MHLGKAADTFHFALQNGHLSLKWRVRVGVSINMSAFVVFRKVGGTQSYEMRGEGETVNNAFLKKPFKETLKTFYTSNDIGKRE